MAISSCSCINAASLKGLTMDCATNVGGIKEVFLRAYADNAFTVSGDTVTSVTSGASWYHYCLRKNTSEYNGTLTVNDNGSRFVQHLLTMVFQRMDATKRAEVQALSYGDVNAVFVDANGKYWAIPQDEPVSATDGTAATGVQKADSNQFTVVIGNETAAYAYELTADAITALEGLV